MHYRHRVARGLQHIREAKIKKENEIVTDVKCELNYTLGGLNERQAISYFQKTIYCLQLPAYLFKKA